MTALAPHAEGIDLDRIEGIAARLDLREPNKAALESIVFETARHFLIEGREPPFEAVVDSATGAGKTYILAAAIEYFAAEGVRNFAVITPGRTILDKTVANFTPGHPKSLLGGMETRPVVITSENFASAAMRAAMDDPSQVKLFIFTVQALLRPTSKQGRKTHAFQEGLGKAFYEHLQGLDDLIVFADEHHVYYGAKFSAAVRELHPQVLIGLTATPHPKTPAEQIIFRYPLAAAIAEQLVKTPVLVGRRDDRSDIPTKLLDGIRLLELKEQAIARWCAETGATPVNPIMLVVARDIQEAEEIERTLNDPSFAGGRYGGKVLTVHSKQPDVALAQLERVEDPDSPYRIIISVGMLKEGWDVKNVYVIASMRASVSTILTEQTLGRGLRLPFGRYTGIEILDTLEVLGHERYEELLRKAGVLNEQFVDYRTRAVLRRDAEGRLVSTTETTPVSVQLAVDGSEDGAPSGAVDYVGTAQIASVEQHVEQGEEQVRAMSVTLAPREDMPRIRIPILKQSTIQNPFSLADITEPGPFRDLGEQIAAEPEDSLRRTSLRARIIEGPDGLRRTELVTAQAVDRVESPALELDAATLRQMLIAAVLNAPVVPARPQEAHAAGQIVDAFLSGIGPDPAPVLSRYFDRAAARLVQLITREQRKYAGRPHFEEVVELFEFDKTRTGRAKTSQDRFGAFKRGVGYLGYQKSLYAQDWFDSSTERAVANILEDEPSIVCWVRLQTGDLPILWREGRSYNPDFIAVDDTGNHWLIEVKMDREMASDEVQAKRDAARRWANHVNADPQVRDDWAYLLASETDVRDAQGSWEALKRLAA